MRVDAFDFELPKERIALRPANPRDAARLLRVQEAGLADHVMTDLPSLLQPGDLLVSNDTKVIPARLYGIRAARDLNQPNSGAQIELTLHKRVDEARWDGFVKGAKKIRIGDTVRFSSSLSAKVESKGEGGETRLLFSASGPALWAAIAEAGVMPLPPYIASQREVDKQDQSDYQTLFADREGSVAAPTAGLHFTPRLMDALANRGVQTAQVTLHVGAGTFLPVKADNTEDHKMHAEYGEVSQQTAQAILDAKARGNAVVAVGTTTLRLLESVMRDAGHMQAWSGETDIFITPGYCFGVVDKLMTNFHLPKSTLFMLVSAFSGLDRMQAAYKHAIDSEYRFYSYGDGCLLDRVDG